jgi:hypothetical protein
MGKGPSLNGLVLIWFSGFKGEELAVKVYDVQTTSKKDHMDFWPCELKTIPYSQDFLYSLNITT